MFDPRPLILLRAPGTDHLAAAYRHTATRLRVWARRAEMRRELAQLDARQMQDTGLDPLRVRREAAKPFWKP